MAVKTDTVIVGGGQAGLSLSAHLTARDHAHVVLERGRVGERWRSERWDSLHMLTPNWLNQLDGAPGHADPEGFLARDGFVDYLEQYASSTGMPVREHVDVLVGRAAPPTFPRPHRRRGVDRETGRRRDRRLWRSVPSSRGVECSGGARTARRSSVSEARISSPPGRCSSSAPGRAVCRSPPSCDGPVARSSSRSGGHARAVRRYRGRDIWYWLERLGDPEQSVDEVPPELRRTPGFGLSGLNGGEQLDLATVSELGVTVAGRLTGFDDLSASFDTNLLETVAHADDRLFELLARIDAHIAESSDAAEIPPAEQVARVRVGEGPRSLDLRGDRRLDDRLGDRYRREYPWLHIPVFDPQGEIVHHHGVTPVPGLFVLGLRFQSRRTSHTIGGVGRDAQAIADRIRPVPRAAPKPVWRGRPSLSSLGLRADALVLPLPSLPQGSGAW